MPSELMVEIGPDGQIKINATKMEGSEGEITNSLKSLAKEVGGTWELEKHEPGTHVHSHDHEEHHQKIGR